MGGTTRPHRSRWNTSPGWHVRARKAGIRFDYLGRLPGGLDDAPRLSVALEHADHLVDIRDRLLELLLFWRHFLQLLDRRLQLGPIIKHYPEYPVYRPSYYP